MHINSATDAMAAYRSVTVLGRAGPRRRLPAFRAQSTLVSDMAPMPSVAKELFLGHNSIDIWNLRLEIRCNLRQGLRTCLGRRRIGRRLRLGLRRRLGPS